MAGNLESNWENLFIFYANLSPVYVCSSLLTILALFFTWWFSTNIAKGHKDNEGRLKSSMRTQEFYRASIGSSENNMSQRRKVPTNIQDAPTQLTSDKVSDTSMMKHIKTIRQAEIEKQLTAGLSEQQLINEREMQASQLAAIYKLLKEKEDKFQIRSMDELQEQLRLYKSES
ncbi:uncharacterized protein LOC117642045 isoform X2 [Thrips palmi]|uniref:Uncharacterized protein LOC117642045 isoform X2 n=1 Tax=Thrips palmi TaxID=161013 RepID=A0A6P8ZJQ1_THRPL|nr:uncharacterized protein LOC117642045 isoform X2 [Thrips palmi]